MCTLLFCLFPSNAWTTLVTFGLDMWVAHNSLWPAAAPEPRTLHNTQYCYHCYHCGRQSDYSLFTKVWISVDWGIIWRAVLQCRTSMAGTVTDSHSPAVTWLPFQNNASVLIHTTYYSGKIRLTWLPFQNSASVLIHTTYYSGKIRLTWLPFQNSASVIIHTTYYSDKITDRVSLTWLPFQNSASVIIHNIIVTKSAGWVSHDYYFKIVSR